MGDAYLAHLNFVIEGRSEYDAQDGAQTRRFQDVVQEKWPLCWPSGPRMFVHERGERSAVGLGVRRAVLKWFDGLTKGLSQHKRSVMGHHGRRDEDPLADEGGRIRPDGVPGLFGAPALERSQEEQSAGRIELNLGLGVQVGRFEIAFDPCEHVIGQFVQLTKRVGCEFVELITPLPCQVCDDLELGASAPADTMSALLRNKG